MRVGSHCSKEPSGSVLAGRVLLPFRETWGGKGGRLASPNPLTP